MSTVAKNLVSSIGSGASDGLPRSKIILSVPASVSEHNPPLANYDRGFREAFFNSLRGTDKGTLIPFLYHDSNGDKWKASQILYGSRAWEQLIQNRSYYGSLQESDQGIILHAIEKGLLQQLPRNLRLIEYGPGEETAVQKKTFPIVTALLNSRSHRMNAYTAVDKVARFSRHAALLVSDLFSVETDLPCDATLGDFMNNGHLEISERNGTPVILTFGGTFFNAPSIEGNTSAIEMATHYMAKVNVQHGVGTHLVMTFNTEQDPKTLKKQYAPTKGLRSWIMSSFHRAVEEKLILNEDYDPDNYWNVEPEVLGNRTSTTVRQNQVCQEEHLLETPEGVFSICKGQKIVVSESHKWDKPDLSTIFEESGWETKEIFEQEGNPNKLVVAEAVRRPPAPA